MDDPLVRDAEEDDQAMWLDVLYGGKAVAQHQQSQKYRSLLSDIAGGDYWEAMSDSTFVGGKVRQTGR